MKNININKGSNFTEKIKKKIGSLFFPTFLESIKTHRKKELILI
jgi:hypothetical protein